MSYIFGERSVNNLKTCHIDLQLIAEHALSNSRVDFSITEGHRLIVRQQKLFNQGKTKIDGVSKKGKHNYVPSQAFDFCAYVKGKNLTYDKYHLMYLVGVFVSTAQMLYKQGMITHVARSGTNWDMDGELKYDQNFFDAPHIEIYKPK